MTSLNTYLRSKPQGQAGGANGAVTGVFARMMEGLAFEAAVPKTVMIDATYLKAHRTASSLGVKKGGLMTKGVA